MSRTFKTKQRLRRWARNRKYSFLFRELIDYSGTYTHWRKHKPYGAKINIKNSKHSYDAWAKNAFVTDINDKDFYVNIRIRINKKSQRKRLTNKLIEESLQDED